MNVKQLIMLVSCLFISNEASFTGNHLEQIVQIHSVRKEYSFLTPWQDPEVVQAFATGAVIGDGLILTNSHAVQNSLTVWVRLNGSDTNYEAEVLHVGYDCDLAIISVDDDEFKRNSKIIPLQEEDLSIGSPVKMLGFDLGFHTPSLFEGIVSRNSFWFYGNSMFPFPIAQIQVPIWPGNSGSPVISEDGNLAGIAFQSVGVGDPCQRSIKLENLYFMIPIRVVKKFLECTQKGIPYDGLPFLPVLWDPICTNETKKYYGMQEDQTGVIVRKVEQSCTKFRKKDIILEIGEYNVGDDGYVTMGNGERISLESAIYDVKCPNPLPVKIIRDKKERIIKFRLNQTYPLSTFVPPYFIFAGLVFQPCQQSLFSKQRIYLTRTLPGDVNRGCNCHLYEYIVKINDKKIDNICQMINVIKEADGYVEIEMSNKAIFVFNKELAALEQESLLDIYGIPYDRSSHFR